MPPQYIPNTNTPIPQPNPRLLAESLKNGELNLAMAMGQFGAFVRETLKVIEEYAEEQMKLNLERKVKFEKMDKLISDLAEKCQGMQQALLYKEEKYDEKCREVERYKVICELSAKAAVGDNSYYTPARDENNNNVDKHSSADPGEGNVNVKLESEQVRMPPPEPTESRKNFKGHIKLSQNQMHLSQYVHPVRSQSPRSCINGPPSDDDDEDDRRSLAHYYVGGPCKRKIPIKTGPNPLPDSRIRERMEIIGGVNVRAGQTTRASLDRSYGRSDDLFPEDPNKRVKISLSGQTNEIMSSSGNVANQMKQRYTEKDLHRQVAGGCWTRMASRRKKEWPF